MCFPAGAPLIDDNYKSFIWNHYIEIVTNGSDDRRLETIQLSFSKYAVEQPHSHDI